MPFPKSFQTAYSMANKSQRASFRMPPGVVEMLDKLAKKYGTTRNHLAAAVLYDYVVENGGAKAKTLLGKEGKTDQEKRDDSIFA